MYRQWPIDGNRWLRDGENRFYRRLGDEEAERRVENGYARVFMRKMLR